MSLSSPAHADVGYLESSDSAASLALSPRLSSDSFSSFPVSQSQSQFTGPTVNVSDVVDLLRQSQVFDYLRLSTNPDLRKFLYTIQRKLNDKISNSPSEPETIQFSDNCIKINRRDKRQERSLVITNKAIYNFPCKDFSSAKRRIAFTGLTGLVMSRSSDEIVFKFDGSYDYRYIISRRRDLLEMINRWYEKETGRPLSVFLSEEKELKDHVVTKTMQNTFLKKSSIRTSDSGNGNENRPSSTSPSHAQSAANSAASPHKAMNENQSRMNKRSSLMPIGAKSFIKPELLTLHGMGTNSINLNPNNNPVNNFITDQQIDADDSPLLSFREKNSIVEGWLTKKKGSSNKWERKYFILTPIALSYYSPRIKGNSLIDSSVQTKRVVENEEIEMEKNEKNRSIKKETQVFKNFRFQVSSTNSRKVALHLAAENELELRRWMKAFDNRRNLHFETHNHLEGWLMRRDNNGKTWRKQYFILLTDRCWFFEMISKGTIDLTTGVSAHSTGSVEPTEEKQNFAGGAAQSRFAYRWNVTNTSRIFNLAADSASDMSDWIEAVEKASREHTKGGKAGDENKNELPEEFVHAIEQEAPSNQVTFVFTDVQSSTSLWEKVPDAMDIALELHDKILREILKKYHGYEVKTEGDAFMVTFFTALDAILWCLEVQLRLLESDWSEEFVKMPSAKREMKTNESTGKETMIFNGIRIRMGIHTGFPNCRRNPVTGRMDYFGQVVNRSARVSDTGHGGQVVCTQEVVQELYEKGITDPRLPEGIFPLVADCGSHELKGIPEPVRIYQLMPPALSLRVLPPIRTENNEKAESEGKSSQPQVPMNIQRFYAQLAQLNPSIISLPSSPPGNRSNIHNNHNNHLAIQNNHSNVQASISTSSNSSSSNSSISTNSTNIGPTHASRNSAGNNSIAPALQAATMAAVGSPSNLPNGWKMSVNPALALLGNNNPVSPNNSSLVFNNSNGFNNNIRPSISPNQSALNALASAAGTGSPTNADPTRRSVAVKFHFNPNGPGSPTGAGTISPRSPNGSSIAVPQNSFATNNLRSIASLNINQGRPNNYLNSPTGSGRSPSPVQKQ